MFFQSVWSNLTDLFSYVDPIFNRNLNAGTTLWQDFVNATVSLSNNAYQSFAAQVDISHFIEHLSHLTSNGLQIAKNATETIGNEIYSGQFSSVIDILNYECDRAIVWFNFSDFQFRLLREFSLILAGNIILVLLAWKFYGPRISARFLARSTSGGSHKRIEELRTSMSELQLPKELDFKYK